MKFSISHIPVVLLSEPIYPDEDSDISLLCDGEELIEYNLSHDNWAIDFVRKSSGEFGYSESFKEVQFPCNRDWRERRDKRIYIKQVYPHTWFYSLSDLLESLKTHPKKRKNHPDSLPGVDEAFQSFL